MTDKHSCKHIEILNREMGEVKAEIKWLKKATEDLNSKQNWILGGVLLTIFTEIILKMV